VIWSLAQAASPSAADVSLPLLLAARALMGVGEAAAVPCLQSIAARFVPPDSRSQFWGVLSASLSAGTIGAYVLSPPLIEAYGWPFVFLAYGGIGGLLAVLWGAWGADQPAGQSVAIAAPAAKVAAAEAADAEAAEAEVPWPQILSSRPVWALAAAHSSHNFFTYFGLSWLPTYFSYQFGLSAADASSAALFPFIAGAVGSLTAGAACDALVARAGFSLTDARKAMQSVALGGPLLAMSFLAVLSAGVGGLQLTRDEAEALFVTSIGLSAFSAAGFGCGAQDISTRLSSLLYGGTSVFAVIAGASGQYFTGWLLEANGRDFTPMFVLVAVIETMGLIAWNSWWSSERSFE